MSINVEKYFEYIKNNHPGTPLFVREEWRLVTHPGVVPNRYQVSSYGDIYDNMTGTKLHTVIAMGYQLVRMQKPDLYMGEFKVQHIVAWQFVPNPDPINNVIVNHIDGNKTNNIYTNLEWVTYSGNSKHAAFVGLIPNGFERANSYTNEEEIRMICQSIQDRVPYKNIVDRLKKNHPDKSEDSLMAMIVAIKQHKTYTDISKEYDIDMKYRNSKYNWFQIHMICEMLEKGTTIPELMNALSLPKEKEAMFRNDIVDIIRGVDYKEVSKRYNVKHPLDMTPKPYTFTEEQAKQAAEYLVQGLDYTTILVKIFGKDFFETTPHEDQVRYRHALRHIRNKRLKKLLGDDISPKFNDYRKCPGKRYQHRDLGNE